MIINVAFELPLYDLIVLIIFNNLMKDELLQIFAYSVPFLFGFGEGTL